MLQGSRGQSCDPLCNGSRSPTLAQHPRSPPPLDHLHPRSAARPQRHLTAVQPRVLEHARPESLPLSDPGAFPPLCSPSFSPARPHPSSRRSPPLPAPSPTSRRLSPGARSRPFTLVSFSNLTPARAHPPCGPVLVPAVPAAHGSEPSVTIALSGNPKPPVKVLGNHLPGPHVPPGTH